MSVDIAKNCSIRKVECDRNEKKNNNRLSVSGTIVKKIYVFYDHTRVYSLAYFGSFTRISAIYLNRVLPRASFYARVTNG